MNKGVLLVCQMNPFPGPSESRCASMARAAGDSGSAQISVASVRRLRVKKSGIGAISLLRSSDGDRLQVVRHNHIIDSTTIHIGTAMRENEREVGKLGA